MLNEGMSLLCSKCVVTDTPVFSCCNFPTAIITLDTKYATRPNAISLPTALDIETKGRISDFSIGILVFLLSYFKGKWKLGQDSDLAETTRLTPTRELLPNKLVFGFWMTQTVGGKHFRADRHIAENYEETQITVICIGISYISKQ